MSSHLFIYAVSKYEDQNGKDQSRWTRIGAMFPHRNGPGFNLKLELVPRDPEIDIVAMPPRERDE